MTVKKGKGKSSAEGIKPSKKQKTITSVPKTLPAVKELIKSWGFEDPDCASMCAMAGMAKGNLKVRAVGP